MGLAVLAWIVVAGLYLGAASAVAFGFSSGSATYWITLTLGVVAAILLAKQPLPIKRRIGASADIDAASSAVWDAIYPRQRYEYFSATVDAIECIDKEAGHYRYIGPDYGDGERMAFVVHVLETDPGRGFISEVVDVENDPNFASKFNRVIYCLEDLGPGRTRMHLDEEVQNLSLIGFAFLYMGNPPRDYLLQLKAYCEGSRDRSYAAMLLSRSGDRV